jgi:hypothetical protein
MATFQIVKITESHTLDDLISMGYNYFIIDIETDIILDVPEIYLNDGLILSFVRKDSGTNTCDIFGHFISSNQSMDLIYHDGVWFENKYSLI